MRKIAIIAILAFLMSLSGVLAEGVELIVPTSIEAIYINQHNTVDISIRNTQNFTDSFLISVWPTQWISLNLYGITLAPNETKTVTLFVEPPRQTDKGVYEIGVMVKSSSSSASDSKKFLADLLRNFELYFSSVKVNSQILGLGDNLVTTIVVGNLNTLSQRNAVITTNILKDDLVIQKFDDEVSITPSSTHTVTNNIEIKNTLEYGSYKLKVELKDLSGKILDDTELTFNIKRNDDYIKDKTTEFGLFFLTTKITVTNKGNVVDGTYALTESLPLYFKSFFFPDIEPTSQQEVDGRIVYTWELRGLKPNETKIILYQVRFTTVVIAILLIGFGLYIFNYFYFRPHVIKRHPQTISQPKEEAVHIHIRNKSNREIRNIVVKDYVPPLARVMKRFDTVQPEIKLTTRGTSLTWRIDRLGPREERVLSYVIIPVMEIPGGIKLPKAHFMYEGRKHIIDRVAEKLVQRR